MARLRRTLETTLPLVLVKGLNEEERREYELAWRNSTFVTDRIKGYLLEQLDALELDSDQDYNVPNWAAQRADKNGQMRQLLKLIKLLP